MDYETIVYQGGLAMELVTSRVPRSHHLFVEFQFGNFSIQFRSINRDSIDTLQNPSVMP